MTPGLLLLCLVAPAFAQSTPAAAGFALDAPAAERLRQGAVFDGSKRRESPRLLDWEGLGYGLRAQNGQFRSFSLTDPSRDLAVEVGQLGVVSRNPLLAPSVYGSVRKGWESYGGPVDATLKVQGGVVGLKARLFYDDDPALDAASDQVLAGAADVARSFGVNEAQVDWARSQFDYSKDFQTSALLVGSALGQVGKSFQLVGPLDVGLAAGGLARLAGSFPNATFDQTAALRLRGPWGTSAGVFGGVTEAALSLDNSVWRDSLAAGKAKLGLHPDVAPHLSAEVWGPVPFDPGASFDLGAGEQFNPLTRTTDVHLAARYPLGAGGALSFAARYEDEAGPDIEFARTRKEASLGLSPIAGVEAYATAGQEHIRFGNVGVDNSYVLAGLRGSDIAGPHPQSGAVETVLGGKDSLLLPPAKSMELLQEAGRLARLMHAVAELRDGDVKDGWAELKSVYRSLDPEMRARVEALFQDYEPGYPALRDLLDIPPDHLSPDQVQTLLEKLRAGLPPETNSVTADQLAKLVDVLSRPEVYERLLIRFARHMVLEELQTQDVPLWDENVRLSAPAVLALANAYSVGVSPPLPITEKDARDGLDPFLFAKLKQASPQCGDTGDENAYTACLVGLLPKEAADALSKLYGPDLGPMLKDAIQWHADLLRREINRTLLEVFLAAEALNDLTVDKGLKIGALDAQWLIRSFERLDARARGTFAPVLEAARRATEAELKAQDEAFRQRLTDYGLRTAKRLGLTAEVPEEDWAPLLVFYGDGLFDFLARAQARLPSGRTLKVQYNAVPEYGLILREDSRGLALGLPPVRGSVRPEQMFQRALSRL